MLDHVFADRAEAGLRLASALEHYKRQRPVVLALPRGGVSVAAPVARALGTQLEVLIVRKIGLPGNPELAMGALVDGNPPIVVRNEDLIAVESVSEAAFAAAEERERAEAQRRRQRYVGSRHPPALTDRTVLLIDDGIATGATMRAAVRAVRAARPARIVVAVPVGAEDTVGEMGKLADDVVCLLVPRSLGAIGSYYRDFGQVTDEQVIEMLTIAGTRGASELKPGGSRRSHSSNSH